MKSTLTQFSVLIMLTPLCLLPANAMENEYMQFQSGVNWPTLISDDPVSFGGWN